MQFYRISAYYRFSVKITQNHFASFSRTNSTLLQIALLSAKILRTKGKRFLYIDDVLDRVLLKVEDNITEWWVQVVLIQRFCLRSIRVVTILVDESTSK